MNNKTPILPDDLENVLERYYTTPEPSPEFSARLEHELHSKLLQQETRKMFGRKSRLSPRLAWGLGLTVAALLVGLFVASSTMVAAMKRLFGYVPGVGVVEQGAPLRVLAEPVSQTRDGITLTVTGAVLSVDKTVVVFSVENIPLDKLSHEEDNPGCIDEEELHLPDGTKLQINSGSGIGSGSRYESRFTYTPVPADVNEATLYVPCIQSALPGILPEDWDLPLRFVPAPPEMTVFPILEATPAFAKESTAPAIESAALAELNPIVISNVIDTGDSYILSGRFSPPRPTGAIEWSLRPSSGVTLTDAMGQTIPYEYPEDIDMPMPADVYSEVWAVKISKDFVAPLTINYGTTYILIDPQTSYAFDFDAGPNPQVGQTWALNKEIQMADHVFTLGLVRVLNEYGYIFEFFSMDGSVIGVEVNIDGYVPQGGGGGGGGGRVSNFDAGLFYAELPKGKLNIILSNLQTLGETKTWSLHWTPD